MFHILRNLQDIIVYILTWGRETSLCSWRSPVPVFAGSPILKTIIKPSESPFYGHFFYQDQLIVQGKDPFEFGKNTITDCWKNSLYFSLMTVIKMTEAKWRDDWNEESHNDMCDYNCAGPDNYWPDRMPDNVLMLWKRRTKDMQSSLTRVVWFSENTSMPTILKMSWIFVIGLNLQLKM